MSQMSQQKKRPYDRSQGNNDRFNTKAQRVKDFQSLDRLIEVNAPDVVRRPKQPQPEPLVFTGPLNVWYKTVRNGRETRLFLVEIRKDIAICKEKECDKHSQSMSLAKFMKFYVLA